MSKVKTARTEASTYEQPSKPVQANDITEASPDDNDSFSPLTEKLESAIHKLNLAAEDLRDLAETMPAQEHGSAAFVVAEVVKDLNQLYRALSAWETTHEYKPRDMHPLIEHLRAIEMEPGSSDESIDRMLYGCTVLPIIPEPKEAQS